METRTNYQYTIMLYTVRIRILLLVLFIPLISKGQTLEEVKKVLMKVNSLNQIDSLKNQYPNWTIYEDHTMQSDSSKFPDIINSKIGDVITKQYYPDEASFLIKVLSEREEEFCKLKYIYLDGNTLPKSLVDSLRADILTSYNNGEDFESLVEIYTMDGNSTGDLGWFSRGIMVEEFSNAVFNRKKGEIFEVDVTRYNWYYIVLKTHDNKLEKSKSLLVIKYDN